MDKQAAADAGENLVQTEEETQQDEREHYGQAPDFRISFKLPRIIFKSISTEPDAHWLRQVAIATVRRFFYLTEDWHIGLESRRYPQLSGTIIIREKMAGERFEFDGASIPLPWLISLITIGVLRPLGVLLIASIVHDFAFRHGHLPVLRSDSDNEADAVNVPISREQADDLFRDIITVVNGNRVVGRAAWYFVRLGYWLRVRYNGELRTGQPPYLVGLSFLLFLGLIAGLVYTYSLPIVAVSALAIYLAFYVLTLHRLGIQSSLTATVLLLFILAGYVGMMRPLSAALGQ